MPLDAPVTNAVRRSMAYSLSDLGRGAKGRARARPFSAHGLKPPRSTDFAHIAFPHPRHGWCLGTPALAKRHHHRGSHSMRFGSKSSNRWIKTAIVAGLSSSFWLACSGAKRQEVDLANAPLTPSQCAILDTDRSLVVHDPSTIGAADFSLTRTLQAILDSSGGSPTSPAALLQSLIDDFAVSNAPNPVSGLVMPVDMRSESSLVASDLLNPAALNGMVSVALFN